MPMTFQDFRVGLRLIARDPVYSLVSVLGLAVGFGVCLLSLGYARYSWSYDAHVPDADHVYVVKHRNLVAPGAPWYDQAPLFLLPRARTAPGVVAATGYVAWFPLTTDVDGELRRVASLTVLPGFTEMLGLRASAGDLSAALSRPDAVAMTEGAARRLFGTTNVLGRTILLRLSSVDETQSSARVAALLPDPPPNTTIPYELLHGPQLGLIPPPMRAELLGDSEWRGYLLVRTAAGASAVEIARALQAATDASPAARRLPPEIVERLGGRSPLEIRLSPLRAAYFDRDVTPDFLTVPVPRGNRTVVAALVSIAMLVLALAVINYVNLATIRAVRRQREIAVRKVLGAGRDRLALQFLAEALLVALPAAALGVAIAAVLRPVFSELTNRPLPDMLSLPNAGIALALGLVVGIVSAAYPTWAALRMRPSAVLVGRPDAELRGSRQVRRALSVLQLSVAMALTSVTLAVDWQARFAMQTSPGFDPAALLVFDLPTAVSAREAKPRGFIAELSRRPEIAGVAVSNDPVGRRKEVWSTAIRRVGHDAVTTDIKSVSVNFFEHYGIRPVAGRVFDARLDQEADARPLVINAIAARQLGFVTPASAVGQPVLFETAASGTAQFVTKTIVGIAPDVRFHSLREAPVPMAYQVAGAAEGWDGTLTVRARGTPADAERAIRETWPKYFPNSVLDVAPARAIYAANYTEDARMARLLEFATAVALLIAGVGIYVLAADAVQRRRGEIALRKLFGAKPRDIAALVARDVGSIVLLSALLGLPVGAIAIASYLAPYTVHTPFAFWSLAGAAIVAAATAACGAARHGRIALRTRPAVALRS